MCGVPAISSKACFGTAPGDWSCILINDSRESDSIVGLFFHSACLGNQLVLVSLQAQLLIWNFVYGSSTFLFFAYHVFWIVHVNGTFPIFLPEQDALLFHLPTNDRSKQLGAFGKIDQILLHRQSSQAVTIGDGRDCAFVRFISSVSSRASGMSTTHLWYSG